MRASIIGHGHLDKAHTLVRETGVRTFQEPLCICAMLTALRMRCTRKDIVLTCSTAASIAFMFGTSVQLAAHMLMALLAHCCASI